MNALEPALDGCALLEHSKGADGQNGEGVFYRDLATGEWRNVWVTDQGPIKRHASRKTARNLQEEVTPHPSPCQSERR